MDRKLALSYPRSRDAIASKKNPVPRIRKYASCDLVRSKETILGKSEYQHKVLKFKKHVRNVYISRRERII